MNSQKSKIIYCIILAAVTALLSYFVYHLGEVYNIHSQASRLLYHEIIDLNNKYKATDSEVKMLEKQKNELQEQINQRSHINKEIEETVKQSESLQKDIDKAKEKLSDLDEQIEEKKDILSNIESISKSNSGKSLSLKEGLYECPKNISPGRYTVKGNDTLLLYSASNTLKISENLARLDTHSFTFDIEDGEKIRIDSGTTTSR